MEGSSHSWESRVATPTSRLQCRNDFAKGVVQDGDEGFKHAPRVLINLMGGTSTVQTDSEAGYRPARNRGILRIARVDCARGTSCEGSNAEALVVDRRIEPCEDCLGHLQKKDLGTCIIGFPPQGSCKSQSFPRRQRRAPPHLDGIVRRMRGVVDEQRSRIKVVGADDFDNTLEQHVVDETRTVERTGWGARVPEVDELVVTHLRGTPKVIKAPSPLPLLPSHLSRCRHAIVVVVGEVVDGVRKVDEA